jgi:hypothetical protein
MLYIINGESENYEEDQCRIVGTMKDENLKLKGSTRLVYTGLIGGLEHLVLLNDETPGRHTVTLSNRQTM